MDRDLFEALECLIFHATRAQESALAGAAGDRIWLEIGRELAAAHAGCDYMVKARGPAAEEAARYRDELGQIYREARKAARQHGPAGGWRLLEVLPGGAEHNPEAAEGLRAVLDRGQTPRAAAIAATVRLMRRKGRPVTPSMVRDAKPRRRNGRDRDSDLPERIEMALRTLSKSSEKRPQDRKKSTPAAPARRP